MGLRDLKNNLSLAQSLEPKARVATAQGAWVDLQGAKSALAVIDVGAWTDGSHLPSLEDADADDQSDAAAVDAAYLEGAFVAIAGTGQQKQLQKVGYKGVKRYVRVVLTTSGEPSGAVGLVAGAAIVTEPLAKPAA
jgi:hypothetical protein